MGEEVKVFGRMYGDELIDRSGLGFPRRDTEAGEAALQRGRALDNLIIRPDRAADKEEARVVPRLVGMMEGLHGTRLACPHGLDRRGVLRCTQAMTHNLPLSAARLWDSLMDMAKIGATTKGGCNRQTLTDLDAEGRALFQRWGEAAGLTLSVDRLGNMVFRRAGRDPTRKPVAIGSHLDN